MKKFLALSFPDVVFIMLINVKMPTIAGILTFISRITEHEISTAYKTKIPTNEEVSCSKSHRCCIYHANKC